MNDKIMNFFKNNIIEEELRRNVAFQSLVAMRDALSLAIRAQQPPTYEQSLRMYHDLDAEIYQSFDDLLTEKNDNDTVKLFKEKASLESIRSKKLIAPDDLLEDEISEYKKLKFEAEASKKDTKHIDRRIAQLYAALENLKPRYISENAILTRDTFHIDRDYCDEKIYADCKFVDYSLPRNRYLRIRLLHPDVAEQITGADLIYKQVNIETNQMRFVFLQYKTWTDNSIYFSQHTNLIPQLERLQKTLCDNGYCKHPDNSEIQYRLPYCCGFLRPTDKLQYKNSKMVSSGLHVPICDVLKKRNEAGIHKKDLRHYCISHKIFEDMFNLNLLGSRWLDVSEIEDFYKEKKIIEPFETIKLHVKEIVSSKYFDEFET